MLYFPSFEFMYSLLLGVSMSTGLLGMLFFMEVKVVIIEWELMNVHSSTISFSIILDWMSLIFTSVVCFVSFSVVLFSKFYMSNDLYMNRFLFLVMMFVLSMVLLILSFNLMGVLLGWDGLGLISYCLVVYFQNDHSCRAGMLTALINRLGDASLIIGICWMLNCGCWHYFFFNKMYFMEYFLFFIMLAGFTSSAQVPFSSWLPAAMAAPTPVSALVHSSTLVTAGVYLMIRFYPGLDLFYSKSFLFLSLFTMFLASLCALVEYDMSKVVAMSTLSQLGFMMSCLLMGFPELCYFHLLTHALFKSLMFLCVGVYIHNCANNQDIRSTGSGILASPFVSSCFCISSFSLSAVPFLSGYYSSDLIMEFIAMGGFNVMVFLLFYVSSCLTVMYTFRLMFYSFLFNESGGPLFFYTEEVGPVFWSLGILTIGSIMGGSSLLWLIFEGPPLIVLSFPIKVFPLIYVFLGVLVYFEYSGFFINSHHRLWFEVMGFIQSMGFLFIMISWVGQKWLKKSYWFNKELDYGWLEEWGSRGSRRFVMIYVKEYYHFSENSVKLFFIWVVILLWLFISLN